MKRSIYSSIVAAILVTIPLAIYQNFLVPAQIDRPLVKSERTQILSPLSDQVVSMLEDHILLWLDSSDQYSGQLKITDDWGSVLLETPISVLAGESEHSIEVNDSVRKARDTWLYAEVYSGNELVVRQRFGWGLIFLTAGQSNSANFECEKCEQSGPQSHVVFMTDSNNDSGTPEAQEPGDLSFLPATVTSPLANGTGKNVWYYLGEKIWKKSHIPVAFINVGWGATSVDQWLNQLFSRMQYGKFFKLSALLWHQGEQDATSNSRENYRSSLLDLVEQSRNTFEYSVPWFISRAAHCENTPSAGEQEIIAAQNDVITQMGLTDVFAGPNTDSIPHDCHFDTPSQLNQYVDAWYYELKNSSLFGKILN